MTKIKRYAILYEWMDIQKTMEADMNIENDNVCRFLPSPTDGSDINILHFVYEKKCNENARLRSDAFYTIYLVTNGVGSIFVRGEEHELCDGDIFFTFPGVTYTISSDDDLEYMYISFLGARANMLTERLNINKNNFIFKNMTVLKQMWLDSLADEQTVLDLRCKGLFLYSLSALGEIDRENIRAHETAMQKIKDFIDENFTDSELSLNMISKRFAYNPKYVSSAFKKEFGVGITQYTTALRIQKACAVMEEGLDSVKEVAYRCGFADPLYFGRIFKDARGISPGRFISEIKRGGK